MPAKGPPCKQAFRRTQCRACCGTHYIIRVSGPLDDTGLNYTGPFICTLFLRMKLARSTFIIKRTGPPDQVSSAVSEVGCERPSPRACSPLASSPLKHIPLGSSLIRGYPHHGPDSAQGHTPTWAPHGNPDLHLGQRAGVPGRPAPQPRMQPFLSHPLMHSVHSPSDVWGPLPEHAASPPGKAGNPLSGCPVSSPKMCRSGWFLCVDFSINTSVLHLWLGGCVCQGLIV